MKDFRSWDFHNPTEIYFGLNFPDGLVPHIASRTTLLVTSSGGTRRGITSAIEEILKSSGAEYKLLDISTSNPSFSDLRGITKTLDKFLPEQIVAIGGGSVIDLGKILSYSLSKHSPGVENILSSLVKAAPLPTLGPISFIACPTTAGTGSEVTPFATIWDTDNKKKYSISTKNLHPKKAMLFPELTLSLPWDVTLSTGLDALSQCLESVWNKNHTPLTAAIACSGIRLVFEALPVLKENLLDIKARASMLEASLMSGLCISKTRTAMAHSISYPLTAHYNTPHGIACSFTLPDLWDYNLAKDDGRMKDLCEALGYDYRQFGSKLYSFLESLQFSQEFTKTIDSIDAVLRHKDEMYTPGRSDNNLASFDQYSLASFITKAAGRWVP